MNHLIWTTYLGAELNGGVWPKPKCQVSGGEHEMLPRAQWAVARRLL